MSDDNDLGALLDEAWRHLADGVADAHAPARYPTFATVSPQGRPEARTVALRAALRDEGVVEVHTDIETPKVRALRHAPYAQLHIWVPAAQLQLRLSAKVEVLTGPAVEAQWQNVPSASRVSYGTLPIPGTPIDHVHAYEKPASRDRFAVLRCALEGIDLVHLGPKHRRAAYRREDAWRGVWLAP